MRSRHSRRVHLACACATIGVVPMFFADQARCADRTWIDPAGGAYFTAGNWSPAVVPGVSDVALFTMNSAYTVSVSGANPTNQRLRQTMGTVTVDLNTRTYALTATGFPVDPSIAVGIGGFPVPRHAHLVVADGTLSGVNAVLGSGTVGFLDVPIDGRISVIAGGRLTLSGGLVSAFDTQGLLSIASGGDASCNGATLGYGSFASGGMTVSGAGSTFNTTFVNVGLAGDATASVSADGDMTTTQEAYLARFAGSTGIVTVTGAGSSWTNSGTTMIVGGVGAASLTISDGGAVTSPPPRIGDSAGSSGVALVTGTGSRWNATGTGAKIGNVGHGALTISNGGSASFGPVEVGSEAGAVGSVTVSGTGSTWTAGIVAVGKTGTGHIAVTNGGFFDSFNFVRLGGALFSTGTGQGIMTVDGAGSRFDGGISVEETSRLTVSNGAHANLDFVENFGSITLTGGTGSFGTVTGQFGGYGSGRIDVTAGGSFTATSIRQSLLNITGNGRATVRPNGTDAAVTIVQNLAISGSPGAWQGTLDLSDNDLIIDYDLSSPLLTVVDQIRMAHNAGAWNGSGGITSANADSTGFGLAYAQSSDLFTTFPATFSGQSVDDTAVLVMFTRYGDTNLDGTVDLADFNKLAASFGQSNRFWRHGDFNYDNQVSLTDFNLLAGNFGLSAAGPDVSAQDWATLAAAVPEPAVACAGVIATAILCRRRRRASIRRIPL